MSFLKLTVVGLMLLVAVVAGACGQSDEELAARVAAEVERQVALVPPAPEGPEGEQGQPGPQGVAGPQGAVGPVGPQGLTGPQGPQGATGPQGRVGPAGPIGLQGPKGDTGQSGPAGPAGRDGSAVGIPKVLEVEELVVRGSSDGGYIRIRSGAEGKVADIHWYSSSGNHAGALFAGTTRGMVLEQRNPDGSYTEVCIWKNRVGLCE